MEGLGWWREDGRVGVRGGGVRVVEGLRWRGEGGGGVRVVEG